jgi:hypothetical protein
MVRVREDGLERMVTAAEAFPLHLAKRALEGDDGAARQALLAIEEARARRVLDKDRIEVIVRIIWGGAVSAIERLRMGRKLDRYRPTSRLLLEPWSVEEALARLETPLNPVEQEIVLRATRTPKKVNWPSWWVVT